MTRRVSASRLAIILLSSALVAAPGDPLRAQDPALDTARDAAPPPAAQDDPGQDDPTPDAPGPQIPYEVEFTGLEDDDLRDLLRDSSSLVSLKDDPPPSVLGLERRADSDRGRLQTALRSAGFYDAVLDIRVDANQTPAKVTVAVTPGAPYRFKTVTIASTDGAPLPGGDVTPGDIGLPVGERARAPQVVDAQAALLRRMIERGHPFATVAERRVVVDHDDHSMDVTYTVDPGPLVMFGDTKIDGLASVDEGLIRGRLPWKQGDIYSPAKVDRARQQIAQLDVFDTVRVRLAEEPGPGGVTPVDVTLSEKLHRFIGASAFYSSEDGVGGSAYWGHRNLFGGAERLRLGVEVGRIGGDNGAAQGPRGSLDLPDIRLSANFRKPDFLAPRQSLILDFQVASEQPPAYDRVATIGSASLERQVTDQLKVSYGVSGERGRVRSNLREYQTGFIGVPLGVAWDGSDNLLNPSRGYRASLLATPWFPYAGDTDSIFTSFQINASAYRDLSDDGRYVAAARIGVGSTVGASLDEVPPDHRFYAGGGGSVRGYGFQKAGPRDIYGDPTGGRSLFEAGLELRVKVTETVGIVPFVDAGTVFDSAFPDFKEPLKVGAGIGARYYTDFGPLRADVAFPLNADSGDAKWQLYLSLGQAF
ncbi:autotransporter assembly complex protein TamA [Azospirillum aestuarii]|uniref:autotransporter assembly complex protein TamA n=1 Tax=Azospirillum aestuarii TaxID=2802052 RepID=UPI004054DB7A